VFAGISRYLKETIGIAMCSKCDCDAPSLFVEVSALMGVELSWSNTGKRSPTSLLYKDANAVPVMWVKASSFWRPSPTRIYCRAFRGILETEWVPGKPSFFRELFYGLRNTFFGIPEPYRRYETLRREDDNGILAAYRVSQWLGDPFKDWRAEIVVNDNTYQMRREHLPPRLKILHTGNKITVSDEDGVVVTAVVNRYNRDRCRITVIRIVEGVEAVLAFLFMQAREMAIDDSD
jgi:hypothetical protein